MRDIAQNNTINITGFSSETQVTNPSMTVDAAVDTAIQDLITIFRTAINANTVSVTRTSGSLLLIEFNILITQLQQILQELLIVQM